MEGLISEGAEVAKAKGDGDARDAALIGAAQRVEHYEIAAYGTARTLAQQLGHTEAADLLEPDVRPGVGGRREADGDRDQLG